MTLDEFLNRVRRWPNNAYVAEPGFKSLYVRDTVRFGEPCLDIANVETKKKGRGTFTALVRRLHATHSIYVECVTSERFEALLLRLGFTRVSDTGRGFPSYYLSSGDKSCTQ